MVRTKYKVGAILKRDSFYSTSTDLSVKDLQVQKGQFLLLNIHFMDER